MFVVEDNGLLAADLARSSCTLVTVALGNAPSVNHWSAGVQVVVEGRVLLLPSPDACLALRASDLELLDGTNVTIAYGPHLPGHPADVRLVGFTVEAYAAVRGFNLGIRDPKQCLTDLVTRIVWATGEPAVQADLPDEPDAQYSPPSGVVANLPTWRFRPPSAPPLVTAVVMVTDGFEPDCLSSIKAQVLDDLAIVVLDTSQSSGVREWVEQNRRDFLRFGLRDSIQYLAVGNTSHDNESALSLCQGEYLLFMNARDLLLPWAMETCLRRFKAGTSAVAGPRVHFDGPTSKVSDLAERYTNSVAMVRRETAVAVLSHGHPTARAFGSWRFLRPLLGGIEHTSIAMALSAAADPHPPKGIKWLSSTPKAHRMRLADPYLPDSSVGRFLVFRRYCVGKIDEIDAYSRLVGIVASFTPEGVATDEIAVVDRATYADMARLSRANIPYEILAKRPGSQPGRYCRDTLQGMLSSKLAALADSHLLKIQTVDAIGEAAPAGPDALLGWVSYRPSNQTPLNLALSAEPVAELSTRFAGDSSVTYWSKTSLQGEENHD